MAQLLVRKLEETIVQELRKRAAKAGVSMEEAHRRILRKALRGSHSVSFKDHLLSISGGFEDDVFKRKRTTNRRKTTL